MAHLVTDRVSSDVALGIFDGKRIAPTKPVHLGDSDYLDPVWLYHGLILRAKSRHLGSMVTLAWIILGAFGGSRGRRSAHWVWSAWPAMGDSMNRSTWLLARAIWVSFFVVCLVFFGLELVFRILDEAKLPHTNYTAEDIAWVSLSGMPRRLYLDLPLMVLIAVEPASMRCNPG